MDIRVAIYLLIWAAILIILGAIGDYKMMKRNPHHYKDIATGKNTARVTYSPNPKEGEPRRVIDSDDMPGWATREQQ
jgi:hypothetical protein